jgi:hypothetical protein
MVGSQYQASSTYTIDGSVVVGNYHIPNVVRGGMAYKVLFYRSGPLLPASHTLVVNRTELVFPARLILDYFEYTPISCKTFVWKHPSGHDHFPLQQRRQLPW